MRIAFRTDASLQIGSGHMAGRACRLRLCGGGLFGQAVVSGV